MVARPALRGFAPQGPQWLSGSFRLPARRSPSGIGGKDWAGAIGSVHPLYSAHGTSWAPANGATLLAMMYPGAEHLIHLLMNCACVCACQIQVRCSLKGDSWPTLRLEYAYARQRFYTTASMPLKSYWQHLQSYLGSRT